MLLLIIAFGESEARRGEQTCPGTLLGFTSERQSWSGPGHFPLSLLVSEDHILLPCWVAIMPSPLSILPNSVSVLLKLSPPLSWRLETGKCSTMMTCSWPWDFWIRTKFYVCGIDVNFLVVWHWADYSTGWAVISSCVKKGYPLKGEWQTQIFLTPQPRLLTLILPQGQELFSPWPFQG